MKIVVLKQELNSWEWIIEIMAAMFLIISMAYLAINYSSLPEIIPMHYEFNGEPNGFGDKFMIIFLAIISVIAYLSLSTSHTWERHNFNYAFKTTPETEEMQHKNAIKHIRIIKLLIVLLFASIIYETIQYGAGKIERLGVLAPIILAGIFISTAYFIYKSYRIKKSILVK